MDSQGVARRRWAVALLALLIVVVPAACGSGGGEAEQQADSREKDDEADDGDDDEGGAPGEDAGGSDDADDDESDSDESDDSNSDDDEADAARTAYVGYQTMFERLVIEPDSDDPEIADRTSGAELNHVVDTLTGFEGQNLAVEFGSLHEHHVYDVDVDASGDSATVLDCFVSDARVVNATTRSTLRGDPEGGTASLVTATVVHSSDGTWRVDATSAEELGAHESCGANGVIRPGT